MRLQAASLLLVPAALAADILRTESFSSCSANSEIKVNKLDIQFDKANNEIIFDVSGTSEKEQEVTAKLVVTAYGREAFTKEFDPCAEDTKVEQLCPGRSHG